MSDMNDRGRRRRRSDEWQGYRYGAVACSIAGLAIWCVTIARTAGETRHETREMRVQLVGEWDPETRRYQGGLQQTVQGFQDRLTSWARICGLIIIPTIVLALGALITIAVQNHQQGQAVAHAVGAPLK